VFLDSEAPFFLWSRCQSKLFWLLLRLQITNNPVKTNKNNASSSIRFRRWSRAGYAVFCSLACTVTIGCVAISISDKSLQKAVGVTKSSNSTIASESESRDKLSELLELEAAITKIKETTLFEITSDRAAACLQVTNIYFINQNG